MEKKEILDTNIAIERRLAGAVTIFSVIEYPPCGESLYEIIFPNSSDYILSVELANKLRKIGKPIGAIDIMIAAICINRKAKLLTKDNDFKAVKEAFPEFDLKVI